MQKDGGTAHGGAIGSGQPSAVKLAQVVALIWATAVATCAAPAWFSRMPHAIQHPVVFDASTQSESLWQLKLAPA
jgi:hypothetical protein